MISREERKRNLIEYLDDVVGARDYYLDTEDRELIIEALSQPERPKGRWICEERNGTHGYWCSNCHAGFKGINCEWIAKEHDFCPKCGADMRGEEE